MNNNLNKSTTNEELEINAILKVSNENIIVTDGLGNIIKASQNCEKIYDISMHELIGSNVIELERKKIFKPSVTIKVLQSRQKEVVMQVTPKKRHILAKAYPVFNDKNVLCRVISVSQDITDIQNLQDEYNLLQNLYIGRTKKFIKKRTSRESLVLKKIHELITYLSKSNAYVFFMGESGVGKLQLAKDLHHQSNLTGDFIEVNCGYIPESLIDAALFGHVKDDIHFPGLIEKAQNGTLYLNDVCLLSNEIQMKLLHVIETQTIYSPEVGTISLKPFRIISSIHESEEYSKRNPFTAPKGLREELFFRLNIVPIYIPPLRERKQDIIELTQYFIKKLNRINGSHKSISENMLLKLTESKLSGNIRELENIIERLYALSKGDTIDDSNLQSVAFKETRGIDFRNSVAEYEKSLIEQAKKMNSTTYEMAEYLKIPQATLFRKLKKYNI